MRSIVDSTHSFEAWMRRRTDVSRRLLKRKHKKMCGGAFPFLRATFYRWAEQWPIVCRHLAERDEDVLLAVGDLHVENFGVWIDSRKRQVWGINDFDDACELPFTSDLVRLATSVMLAADAAKITASVDRVCALILEGYRSGLRTEGEPIHISGRFPALVMLAGGTREQPKTFWDKKLSPGDNPEIEASALPRGLEDMFRASFGRRTALMFREQRDPGGLGSLGRRRFTAVATKKSKDGPDAREAKALVPSAQYWLTGQKRMRSQTATLLQHVIREPDPHFQVHDEWLVRQLAPDVAKIELPTDARDRRLALVPAMLRLMGRETANMHLGSRSPQELEASLKRLARDENWFSTATERMAACTRDDHAQWQSHEKA